VTVPEARVRRARPEDAEAIAGIYNHYILHSTATFHTEPVDAAERAEWMAERGDAYPTMVAEEAGDVVAWGALSQYKSRPAWAPTVEVAIYVEPQHTGKGIGPRLMADLLAAARRSGYHSAVSQIVGDNEPSLTLAERAGFSEVGRLREAGVKFGRRLDVVIMQVMLDDQSTQHPWSSR
jgi:phosphinothricin acetyltransferase